MNRTSFACALGALLFLGPSCTQSEEATVAGKYEMDVDATVEAMSAMMAKASGGKADEKMMASMKEDMKKEMKGASMELKEDGTWSSNDGKKTEKGKWTIKDGKLTMTNDDPNEKDTATGSFKDGKLSVTMKKMGQEMTMHFTKVKK